jgi:hypothetical protein
MCKTIRIKHLKKKAFIEVSLTYMQTEDPLLTFHFKKHHNFCLT